MQTKSANLSATNANYKMTISVNDTAVKRLTKKILCGHENDKKTVVGYFLGHSVCKSCNICTCQFNQDTEIVTTATNENA